MTKYNFNNPSILAKARASSALAPRPITYKTKKKEALDLRREILEKTLKEEVLAQLGPDLAEITAVMIANAKTPEGHADRRMILRASGAFQIKTPAELDWDSKREERARSKSLSEQLMSMGRSRLNSSALPSSTQS